MACCKCCCPEGEECCKAQGASGICCPPARCCGTEESPVCCPPNECCVDGECGPCPCESDEDCPEGQCCVDGECGECPCESDEDCPEGECCVDGECGECPCVLNGDCPEGQVCCRYFLPDGTQEEFGECIEPPCCYCEAFHETLDLRLEWPGLWEDDYTLNLVVPIPFTPFSGCTPEWVYESGVERNEDDGQVCLGEFVRVRAGPAPLITAVKVLEDGTRLTFSFGGGNAPNAIYELTQRDPPEIPGTFMWCTEYSFVDNWDGFQNESPGFSVSLQQASPRSDFCSDTIIASVTSVSGGSFYLSSP